MHIISILPEEDPACNFRLDSCNLLMNGNFDESVSCPVGGGQIVATGWYKGVEGALCSNSSDYFNLSCPPWNSPFLFSPLMTCC